MFSPHQIAPRTFRRRKVNAGQPPRNHAIHLFRKRLREVPRTQSRLNVANRHARVESARAPHNVVVVSPCTYTMSALASSIHRL